MKASDGRMVSRMERYGDGAGGYRRDQEVVKAALGRGERPDLATPLGARVVDELLALHEELGILKGAASEKGREASVTRALIEQTLAVGGAGCIRLLLADALYAAGRCWRG